MIQLRIGSDVNCCHWPYPRLPLFFVPRVNHTCCRDEGAVIAVVAKNKGPFAIRLLLSNTSQKLVLLLNAQQPLIFNPFLTNRFPGSLQAAAVPSKAAEQSRSPKPTSVKQLRPSCLTL